MEPDYAVMEGEWSNSQWIGKWWTISSPDLKEKFHYSPEVEDYTQNVPCEICHKRDGEKMLQCRSCDVGVHQKCQHATPYFCKSCYELNREFKNIPPVSRKWSGNFYMLVPAPSKDSQAYRDTFKLKFQYIITKASELRNNETIVLANIQGSGQNDFGMFAVQGKLSASLVGSPGTYKYVMAIKKKFGVSNWDDELPQPLPIETPATRNDLIAAEIQTSHTHASRPKKNREEDEDSEPPREKKRPRTITPRNPKISVVTFVTNTQEADNSLIALWREVITLGDIVNVLCTSKPDNIPLRSMLRIQTSNEKVFTAIKSPRTMASITCACKAVDMAIENNKCSLSAATGERITDLFPCAVAVAYAHDRYGKNVGVLDISQQNVGLESFIQGMKGLAAVSSIREASEDWTTALKSCLDDLQKSNADFLVISASFSQRRDLGYINAIDQISALGYPYIIVLEDASAESTPVITKAVLNRMAKFSPRELSDSSPPSPIPQPSHANSTMSRQLPKSLHSAPNKSEPTKNKSIVPIPASSPPLSGTTFQSSRTATSYSMNGGKLMSPPAHQQQQQTSQTNLNGVRSSGTASANTTNTNTQKKVPSQTPTTTRIPSQASTQLSQNPQINLSQTAGPSVQNQHIPSYLQPNSLPQSSSAIPHSHNLVSQANAQLPHPSYSLQQQTTLSHTQQSHLPQQQLPYSQSTIQPPQHHSQPAAIQPPQLHSQPAIQPNQLHSQPSLHHPHFHSSPQHQHSYSQPTTRQQHSHPQTIQQQQQLQRQFANQNTPVVSQVLPTTNFSQVPQERKVPSHEPIHRQSVPLPIQRSESQNFPGKVAPDSRIPNGSYPQVPQAMPSLNEIDLEPLPFEPETPRISEQARKEPPPPQPMPTSSVPIPQAEETREKKDDEDAGWDIDEDDDNNSSNKNDFSFLKQRV